MSKVKDVKWFTAGSDTIGIVLVDTGYEKKAYIGLGKGVDEEADIKRIKDYGGKVYAVQLQSIIDFLKEEK